jgi:hypothetical protein
MRTTNENVASHWKLTHFNEKQNGTESEVETVNHSPSNPSLVHVFILSALTITGTATFSEFFTTVCVPDLRPIKAILIKMVLQSSEY